MERVESLQKIYVKIISKLNADPSVKHIRYSTGEQFIYPKHMSIGVSKEEGTVEVRILVRRELMRFFQPDKSDDHWRCRVEIKEKDEQSEAFTLQLIKSLMSNIEFMRRIKNGKLMLVTNWKEELSRTAVKLGLQQKHSWGQETFRSENRIIMKLKGKQKKLRIFFLDEPNQYGLEKKYYRNYLQIFHKKQYVAEINTSEQFIRLLTYLHSYLTQYLSRRMEEFKLDLKLGQKTKDLREEL